MKINMPHVDVQFSYNRIETARKATVDRHGAASRNFIGVALDRLVLLHAVLELRRTGNPGLPAAELSRIGSSHDKKGPCSPGLASKPRRARHVTGVPL